MNKQSLWRRCVHAVAYALFIFLFSSLSVVLTVFIFLLCMRLHVVPLFYIILVTLIVGGAFMAVRQKHVSSNFEDDVTGDAATEQMTTQKADHPSRGGGESRLLKMAIITGVLLIPFGLLGYLTYSPLRSMAERQFINAYARELPQALITGPYFDSFLRKTEHVQSPTERFRIQYSTIMAMWRDQTDAPGNDQFRNVEETMRDEMRGDCEDKAAVTVALARSLGLDAVVVLGQSHDGRGHAWAEVLVSQSAQLPPDVVANIQREFANTAYLVQHDNQWWLVCSPVHSLDSYEPRWLIEPTGQLIPVVSQQHTQKDK